MSISADKKNGVATGRWRVELQKGQERYRQRHDTRSAAVKDEARVKALWAAGETVGTVRAATGIHVPHTILTAKDVAQGTLWDGQAQEDTCWAHIAKMSGIIGKNVPLDDIDTLAVDKVVKRLKTDGIANGTINRYLSHLKVFLTWCRKRKMTTLPLDDIEFSWAKEAQGRIRWVTPEEEASIEKLVPTNVWKLIKVAIETGCRRAELLGVELEQINGDRLHLWETKTDSPRTVYMEPETTEMLVDLVTTGTMPTKNYLRRQWEKVRTSLDLDDDEDFVFHCCRHTRATRLVEAGIDIRVIKEMMGHKRIETTLRYAHVKASNIESAMEKVGEYNRMLAAKRETSAAETVPLQ